ncbi:MAG TPA: cytochrome c3 family protein [bacterium]|jgi:predicted CXXCH cytochrome family protein
MKPRSLALVILILVMAIFVACQHGKSPVTPDPTSQIAKYVSAATCISCHVSKGVEWKTTAHSRALEDLEASGNASSYCYGCHTTGLDDNPGNSGYDDPDEVVAARFGGVQCEVCHGPGSKHVATRELLRISADPAICGQCHSGAHNKNYEDWQTSAHAMALEEPRENSAYFAATLECLGCHSADYIFADSVPEDADAFDFEFGITCAVCHDPHENENPHQLRNDVAALCASCHTAEDALPTQSPHHPQGDVYLGRGAYEYPGEDYMNSGHASFEDGCAQCHMWSSPFDATGNGEDAISGHTFQPVIQACQECHPTATDFNIGGIQDAVDALLSQLDAEIKAATDEDKLTLAYERAKFNYGFINSDGSRGVHNPTYVIKLLQDSIANFEPST